MTPLVITGYEQLSSSICCRVMAGQSLPWKGKKNTENEKRFYAILTTRLAESVDGLDSSLAQSPGEL